MLVKKFMFIFFSALFLSFTLSINAQKAPKYKYVGTKTCRMCHNNAKSGNQYKIWQHSKHAQAYKILLSKKANDYAMKKYGKKAIKVEKCLTCHTTGSNVAAKFKEHRFKVEDGVQCETCHGPGSAYKSYSVMKSRKKAIAKGLIIYTDPSKLCVKCHNKENPFYKKFDFNKYWKQIVHNFPNLPKKK